MQKDRTSRRLGAAARGAGMAFVLALVAASGCADEVGGDGYQPPRPTSGGLASAGGAPGEGGAAGDEGTVTAGKGGKGGSAGHAGKGGTGGGTGGTGIVAEGGAGGSGAGSLCGNGQTEPGEECDDGNTKSGDGCTADCKSGCEVCEKTYCKAAHEPFTPTTADFYNDCFQMQGKAAGGKAQGESRSVLCQAVVDCVRRERCAQILPFDFQPVGNLSNQFLRCFCDRDVTEGSYVTRCSTPPSSPPKPDEAAFVPGKCSEEFLEASEVDNLSEAFKGQLTAKTKPFGGANLLLLECDRILCTEECMPEASSGTVAQIAADILTTPNDAGETPFGDLVADSERSAMSTDFAFFDQAAMQPEYVPDPWGLFFKATPGRPADGDGRILESEVLQALFGIEIRNSSINPSVGTNLVTMQLTGAQVYAILNSLLGTIDVSGLAYTWDATLPSGTRVTEVRKGGVPLDRAATFSLAVSNALAKSITGGANVVNSEKRPAQELITYLKAQPQAISPPPSDRVIRLD